MSISSLFIPNSYILHCGNLIVDKSLSIAGGSVQALIKQETLAVPATYNAADVGPFNCIFKKFSYGGDAPVSYVLIEVPVFNENAAAASFYTFNLAGDALAAYRPLNDTDNQLISIRNSNAGAEGYFRTNNADNTIHLKAGFPGANFAGGNFGANANENGLYARAKFIYQSVV